MESMLWFFTYFSHNDLVVDLEKTDILGENCLHYLSQNRVHHLREEKITIQLAVYYENMDRITKNFQKKLLTQLIFSLQEKDSQKAREMLSPEKIKEYFKIAIDSNNFNVASQWIDLGVLDNMKQNWSEIYEMRNTLGGTKEFENLAWILKLQSNAAKDGDQDLLDKLNSHGISLDWKDVSVNNMDETPLFQAVRNGQVKTALWLLEKKADPNAKNAIGENPLMVLCSTKNSEQHMENDYKNFDSSRADYFKLLHILLDNTNGIHELGGYANKYIHEAIRCNNLETAKTMANIGYRMKVSEGKTNTMFKLPIQEHPNFFEEETHLPNSSIRIKDILNLELQFIEGYQNSKIYLEDYNQPIFNATAMTNVKELKRILEIGVDANIRGRDQKTPLMFGAQYGNTEILKLLTDHHADIFAIDAKGKTALDYAIENNQVQNVSFLIRLDKRIKVSEENIQKLADLLPTYQREFQEVEIRGIKKIIEDRSFGRRLHQADRKPHKSSFENSTGINQSDVEHLKRSLIKNRRNQPPNITNDLYGSQRSRSNHYKQNPRMCNPKKGIILGLG
jgi:ankyrin repeat protein